MGSDEELIRNAQKTIDRLIRQLAEIDNEKDTLEEEEYRELRKDTVHQLEEYGKIVERLQGGDVSLIDDLTATKIAIRAAISKAFQTPEVMALFSGKHTGLLREKLMMVEANYRSLKTSKQEYLERKLEILMALRRLEEPLTQDEQKFLNDRLETPEFRLIEANDNRIFPMSIQKKRTKLRLDDVTENVSPPWQAWWHTEKKLKFYTNSETKESIWEHPGNLKNKEKSSSSVLRSRKRMDPKIKRNSSPDIEEMETEVGPPPKHISLELMEVEEFTPKRSKRLENIEKTKINDPQSAVTDQILPRVRWASEIRAFNRIPYRACAIFDTCALIENPNALDSSVEKQILTVIPYAVLSELDGLKNAENTRREAVIISKRLRDLQEEKNYYLRVETSVEQQVQIYDYRANATINDDLILKCALRIKTELLSISSILNLNDRAVLLVTNDLVLSNKAMTHDLTVETVYSFLDIINGREKKKSASRHRSTLKNDSPRTPQRDRLETVEQSCGTYRNFEAMKQVRKQRDVKEWISELAKKDASRHSSIVQNQKEVISSIPRPSIPLEDEISSEVSQKPTKAKSSFHLSTDQEYQATIPVKSVELNRIRPQMPLSLSDDEFSAGDEMDCL